jgi:hypothetical protein
MIVGDGRNTPIWKSRWIDGVAPKDIAPNIFFKKLDLKGEVCTLNFRT